MYNVFSFCSKYNVNFPLLLLLIGKFNFRWLLGILRFEALKRVAQIWQLLYFSFCCLSFLLSLIRVKVAVSWTLYSYYFTSCYLVERKALGFWYFARQKEMQRESSHTCHAMEFRNCLQWIWCHTRLFWKSRDNNDIKPQN